MLMRTLEWARLPGDLIFIAVRADAESEALVRRLRDAPEVPAAAHVDGPKVELAVRRALARAGFDAALLDS